MRRQTSKSVAQWLRGQDQRRRKRVKDEEDGNSCSHCTNKNVAVEEDDVE